jgi:hypothetical protein
MSQIANQGNLNIAALSVDDVYIVIVPPGPSVIRGVPTNIAGIVGTAHWGPLDLPVATGSSQEDLNTWGPVNSADPFDIPTALALARLAGGSDFRCVRVSKASAAAASAVIKDDAAATLGTFTAKYTGTFANGHVVDAPNSGLKITVSDGSKGAADYVRLTVQMNGTSQAKEVYDNLPRDGTDFKAAMTTAVVSGQGPLRPPSALLASFAGGGGTGLVVNTDTTLTDPTVAGCMIYLSGGVDGNPTPGGEVSTMKGTGLHTLIGGEGSAGTAVGGPAGMYALENTGASQFILFGQDDVTKWPYIQSFAASRGMLGIVGWPAGTESSTAITDKADNGLDTVSLLLCKDGVLWDDPVTKTRVVTPPEATALGKVANLSPEQGVGNKQVSIVGTERTRDNRPYTNSEIASLETAGIDFFTNPIPAGSMFGLRHNQNGSSDGTINGVNYTRMTNFLSASFAASLGKYIGKVQSSQPNDQLRHDARATLNSFLGNLANGPQAGGAGMIDSFSVILDETNNTPTTIGQGFLNAYVSVRYLAVVRFFIVSLQGGQTVVVVTETNPAGNQLSA